MTIPSQTGVAQYAVAMTRAASPHRYCGTAPVSTAAALARSSCRYRPEESPPFLRYVSAFFSHAAVFSLRNSS